MNHQEAFNTMYNGVLKQGCASMDYEGTCLYRGDNGAKCNAGYLIDDEHYDPEFNSAAIYNADVSEALQVSIGSKLISEDFSFIGDAQQAHDSAALTTKAAHITKDNDGVFIAKYKVNMKGLAESYGLTIPTHKSNINKE